MNVLITGVGGPAGINVLNHTPQGIAVFGMDSDTAAVERIKKAGVKLPVFITAPRADSSAFMYTIREMVRKYRIDLIIPTVDEELLQFSRNPAGTKVVIPPETTINTCRDKFALYEALSVHGLCPKYVLGGSHIGLQGPVFVKPRIGRGSRNTASFHSAGFIPQQYKNDDYLISEYLPGTEYTVDAMCGFDGSLIFAVPRVRTEVLKGISVRGRTENNVQILERVSKICKALKFTGPINLQFKLDASGLPKLVEINPRFSGGLGITVAAGINPVEVLLDLAEGRFIDGSRLRWRETEASNDVIRRLRA